MNETASWWSLSLLLACLCAWLAWPTRERSFFSTNALVSRHCPEMAVWALRLALVPTILAAAALALSEWLTAQSVLVWLGMLEVMAAPVGVLLSLQAVGLLFHGRVYGGVLVLLPGALSLQHWLYYQALDVEFTRLGMMYALALLILLPGLIFSIGRIDIARRLPAARFLACLLLVLQWLYATDSRWTNFFQGYDWITLESAVLAPGLMFALIGAGYLWQHLRQAISARSS